MRFASIVLLLAVLAVRGTAPAAAAPPETTVARENTEVAPASASANFESLLHDAAPMGDLGTLLAPLTGKCDGDKREVDRIRCRTVRAYLRRVIPRQSFWTVVDDPSTITVSDYDASIKGYHLSVSGCLACTRAVTLGRQNETRLVTLKVPAKGAESLQAAVELSHNSVAFENLSEAKAWLEQSRSGLRVQAVFQPSATEWTFGSDRGLAMNMLGVRVFNRCTGEILVSKPPSTGTIELAGVDDGCRRAEVSKNADDGDQSEANDGAAELSKNDIEQAMNIIRPQVFACFEKFKIPGMAQFEFVVAGNGTVNNVRLSGPFSGTPTGACLLEAAQNAHFPRSSQARQQFVYPFFLRR